MVVHGTAYVYDPEINNENEFDPRLKPFETSRAEAYACDITYGTNNEFGFDYLRDNMVSDLSKWYNVIFIMLLWMRLTLF